jgi:hypothetical protein
MSKIGRTGAFCERWNTAGWRDPRQQSELDNGSAAFMEGGCRAPLPWLIGFICRALGHYRFVRAIPARV